MKLVKSYISGPNTDDIEFTRSKNKSFAMLKDGLGSTIVLSDKNGRSIARIGYDAWGNFRWSKKAKESCGTNNYDEYLERFCNTRGFGHKSHNSWSFGKKYANKLTPYLYTGKRFNRFTTQYFHRNRYYQPQYGRFTTKDPIGFNGDSNLYRYANDNPVLFSDPMGLETEFIVINNSANPDRYLLFKKGISDPLKEDLTYQEAEDIVQCDGIFSNLPSGMTDSEKMDWIAKEAVKVIALNAAAVWLDRIMGDVFVGRNTAHVTKRLIQRGFSEADIQATKSGFLLRQSDGATVFIKEVKPGKFNVIVEGPRGIITGMKKLSQGKLDRLKRNYGWH